MLFVIVLHLLYISLLLFMSACHDCRVSRGPACVLLGLSCPAGRPNNKTPHPFDELLKKVQGWL